MYNRDSATQRDPTRHTRRRGLPLSPVVREHKGPGNCRGPVWSWVHFSLHVNVTVPVPHEWDNRRRVADNQHSPRTARLAHAVGRGRGSTPRPRHRRNGLPINRGRHRLDDVAVAGTPAMIAGRLAVAAHPHISEVVRGQALPRQRDASGQRRRDRVRSRSTRSGNRKTWLRPARLTGTNRPRLTHLRIVAGVTSKIRAAVSVVTSPVRSCAVSR